MLATVDVVRERSSWLRTLPTRASAPLLSNTPTTSQPTSPQVFSHMDSPHPPNPVQLGASPPAPRLPSPPPPGKRPLLHHLPPRRFPSRISPRQAPRQAQSVARTKSPSPYPRTNRQTPHPLVRPHRTPPRRIAHGLLRSPKPGLPPGGLKPPCVTTTRSHNQLGDFVIMPNHVHALVGVSNSADLSPRTSKPGNPSAPAASTNLLHRHGTLWQPEPFDHIVRDVPHWKRFIAYIQKNPANLPPNTFTLARGSLAPPT